MRNGQGCAAEMIAVLILAAGASSRMQGRDKLLEQVDGMPLLRRQTLRACATGCCVLVALPPAPHPRYDALKGVRAKLVPVPDAAEGMNASLRAGLAALPKGVQAVMVMLGDMPELTTEDLCTVRAAVDPGSDTLIWRAVTQSGAAGHPTVFHAQLLPELMRLTGDGGGRAVVQAHTDRTMHIPLPADHARTDLDTPADWAAWRADR
jgi:molybdenum cofactor cytidylyltransferase